MKKLFLFSMLTLAFCQLSAQDLIVTTKGDSLNCKITKVKPDYIYFTFNNNGHTQNSLLPSSDVDYYQYGTNGDYAIVSIKEDKNYDLVILNNGDTIHCEIVSIKHNYLYYTTDGNKEALPQSVPLSDVKSYKYGYSQTYAGNSDYQKISFSINNN